MNKISYDDFIARKNKLYCALQNQSETVEKLRNQTSNLLTEVNSIYSYKSIVTPKWVVNIAELWEFYMGIEFNYNLLLNKGDNDKDKKALYDHKFQTQQVLILWDRLVEYKIYSIHDCALEIDEFHCEKIVHYNFAYDYLKTGLFQLRSLGILSHHYENNNGTLVDYFKLASRYLDAYKVLRKNKYDLRYSDDIYLRKELINGAIDAYEKAYHCALKANNNRHQSISYYHLMKSKEISKKFDIRYYISKFGNYPREKHLYKSNYYYYLYKTVLGKPDYIVNLIRYVVLRFLRLIAGYGERPINVVLSALFTLLIFSPLYMLNGFRMDGEIIKYEFNLSALSTLNSEIMMDFYNSLYFSMITFTTLGYGDSSPIGYSKLFASIESFCGAIFISIFIFTLARQIQR